MFRGEFNKTVDQKGRAGIPAVFREWMLYETGD
jgi:DNA-binding transcriptional regulator/RsmH inhibitor MraZ